MASDTRADVRSEWRCVFKDLPDAITIFKALVETSQMKYALRLALPPFAEFLDSPKNLIMNEALSPGFPSS